MGKHNKATDQQGQGKTTKNKASAAAAGKKKSVAKHETKKTKVASAIAKPLLNNNSTKKRKRAGAFTNKTTISRSIIMESPPITPTPSSSSSCCAGKVCFSPTIVTKIIQYPDLDIDRQALPADLFSCDICGIDIPAGIHGFEVYATCSQQDDCDAGGYDVCLKCLRKEQVEYNHCSFLPDLEPTTTAMTNNTTTPGQQKRPNLVRVKGHEHVLQFVDRQAEVSWCNDGIL